MEKKVAIQILEDVRECLNSDDFKNKTLSTIKQYKKNLLIATNEALIKLAEELKKYDENSKEYSDISNKMADIMYQIFQN